MYRWTEEVLKKQKKEKVSYNKVYKKLSTEQLILHLIHTIIIIIIINSINPRGVGLVSIHHNYNNQYHYINSHPIRTLYPNKIIVSNKLLGLSRLGLGLRFGSGLILYA